MKITRTIKATTSECRVYNKSTDTLEVMTVTVAGKIDSKPKFLKAVEKAKAIPDTYTLLGCSDLETSEALYECTLEDFLSVATPVGEKE